MKVTNTNLKINNVKFAGGLKGLQKKFAQSMSKFDQLGEAANISFDFIGKALVVPAVIMLAADESPETKKYSAIKNPIGATVQLLLEVPILYFGSKFLVDLANKGKLDKAGSLISYNEKNARDSFIKILQNDVNDKKIIEDLTKKLNKKELTRKVIDEIDEVVTKMPSKVLKQNFENFKTVHKRLYHMRNRVCFAAALLLTPAICIIENWAHPKIMNLLPKPKKSVAIAQPWHHVSFQSFRDKLKAGKQ